MDEKQAKAVSAFIELSAEYGAEKSGEEANARKRISRIRKDGSDKSIAESVFIIAKSKIALIFRSAEALGRRL